MYNYKIFMCIPTKNITIAYSAHILLTLSCKIYVKSSYRHFTQPIWDSIKKKLKNFYS